MAVDVATRQMTTPSIEAIVEKYCNTLLRVAFMYVKDVHLAEDAVQETYIKIFKKYQNTQDRFVSGVAYNR